MTDEVAALDPNMPPEDVVEVETPEATTEEPVEVTEEPAPSPDEDSIEEPKEVNKVQERINKITADKWAEKRRADELERKLAEMQTSTQDDRLLKELKLEDFDFDDAAYQAALIKQEIAKGLKEVTEQQKQAQAAQQQEAVQVSFNEKVAALVVEKPDYADVVGNLPEFPSDTLAALMESENGPELAYYLGQHADIADSIATASPIQAAMKLGQISAQLSAQPVKEVKTSAAPEPIEPVSASGSLNKSIDDMSMEEIMAL